MRHLAWEERIAIAAALAASLTLPGCGGNTVTPPSRQPADETLSVKLTTAHFEIYADRTEPSWLQHVADTLELQYPRVTSDFEVPDLPQTHVRVWADQAGFYAEGAKLGHRTTGARGWVLNRNTFAIRADTGGAAPLAECAVHEFTHIVSLSLNPAWASGVPMWLRETAPLYEAGQLFDPRSFDYMRAGNYPTIASLDADMTRLVNVGHVLGEYIVEKWGMHGFVLLFRASGDISEALGISTREFESGWYAFLHEKYGLPSR